MKKLRSFVSCLSKGALCLAVLFCVLSSQILCAANEKKEKQARKKRSTYFETFFFHPAKAPPPVLFRTELATVAALKLAVALFAAR